MLRYPVVLLLVLFLLVAAQAFEVGATIRRLDPEKRVAEVFAGGQNRSVRIARDVRILDRDGKELPEGLKSPFLREGDDVTLRVEPENGEAVIREIGLGGRAGMPGVTPTRPRTEMAVLKPIPE